MTPAPMPAPASARYVPPTPEGRVELEYDQHGFLFPARKPL